MKRIKKYFKNPKLLLIYILKFKLFRLIPDELFIKIEFYLKMGTPLNLENPRTFNEKLQWLKLHDRNPLYTKLVDKYEVREYITESIGQEYLIPLYGVYDSYEQIDFENLPNQFVLKATHTSGDVYICKDKRKIDYKELKNKVNKWLNKEYFWFHREWPYKNVKPRIIAEKYMVDETIGTLNDYKFYCFNGEPKTLLVATEREKNVKFDTFDMSFNHLPIGLRNSNKTVAKPDNFENMVKIVKKLSANIPHVRIDLYSVDGKIYFGEYTFYSDAGYELFYPNHEKYTKIYGDWLEI